MVLTCRGGTCDQITGYLIFLVSTMAGSLKAQQLGCKRKKAGVSLNQRSRLWGCHIFHMPLVNAIIGPVHIQEDEDWLLLLAIGVQHSMMPGKGSKIELLSLSFACYFETGCR